MTVPVPIDDIEMALKLRWPRRPRLATPAYSAYLRGRMTVAGIAEEGEVERKVTELVDLAQFVKQVEDDDLGTGSGSPPAAQPPEGPAPSPFPVVVEVRLRVRL